MSLFLNTPKLNHWIPKLIKESQEELILIVPYIQTSENVINALKIADSNGIEITLVYRENKLSEFEKEKLLSLKNISLLHHPNVHCKCYYNGELLIVGSMNLYEYSEKNNREMGMLMSRKYIDDKDGNVICSADKKDVFREAMVEIREIINGASLEKASEKAKQSAFEIGIIKNEEEKTRDFCELLNKSFLNKKFKPFKHITTKKTGMMSGGGKVFEIWYPKCENYFDKVDVTFESRRIAIKFKLEEKELEFLYKSWMDLYDEFEFHGFKYYWNGSDYELVVYNHDNFDWTEKNQYQKYFEGLTEIINKYRMLIGK